MGEFLLEIQGYPDIDDIKSVFTHPFIGGHIFLQSGSPYTCGVLVETVLAFFFFGWWNDPLKGFITLSSRATLIYALSLVDYLHTFLGDF